MILKKNYEDNQTSSLMTHNNDFEKLDKKLELMIQEKDELLNKKNQFVLNQERINNQLNLISLQEKNLQESVKELSNAHNEWIKKRDDYKSELASLDGQKSLLEKDLGILRRKRDELNSSISNKRQEINQLTLKLEYLERDISSLNEEMRSETIKLENYKKELPDPLPSLGEYENKTLDLLQSEIVMINTKLESLEPVNMLALDGGQPKQMGLIEILNAFIEFRFEVVTRRTKFMLNKSRNRAHVLAGLMVAITSIDEVIELIKASSDPDNARKELCSKPWPAKEVAHFIKLIDEPDHQIIDDHYKLSVTQAKAILELRLQRLTGMERSKLEKMANSNIKFLKQVSNMEVENYMSRCRAFVYAGLEDFGIAPIEAMASGAPVIGYGKGGILDTVICFNESNKKDFSNGILFKNQTISDMVDTIDWFEDKKIWEKFDPQDLNNYSKRFSPEIFKTKFDFFINKVWQEFKVKS
mgnify:CR=1 FL=1